MDYQPLPWESGGSGPSSLSVGPGSGQQAFSVVPIGNGVGDADKTVVVSVTLETGPGYGDNGSSGDAGGDLLEPNGNEDQATVNIKGYEPPPTVSIAPTLGETDIDSTSPMTFTVTRAGPTANSVVVVYSIDGTACNGDDYFADASHKTFLSGCVTIQAGSSQATINIYPSGVAQYGADKTIVLTLSPPSGYTVNPSAQHAEAILDISDLPEASISGDQAVTEWSDPAGEEVDFTVSVSPAPLSPVDVVFQAYGTAVEGTDYTLPSTELDFVAGQTTATLEVDVLNDQLADGDKRLTLALNPDPASYTLDPWFNTATLTIHDGAPTVSVSGGPPVAEGDTAEFTLGLSHAAPYQVIVNVQPVPLTAGDGDLDCSAQQVVFPPNATEETLYVQTFLNSDILGDEQFYVDLVSSVQAHLDPDNDRDIGIIAPVKAALTVDDGNGNPVPHKGNLSPGGLVFVQPPGGLLAEAVPLKITLVDPPYGASGHLQLAYSGKLEIYDGGSLVTAGTLLPFASATLYVVGVSGSGTLDDADVSLSYVVSGSADLPLDEAAYTVEQVNLMMSQAGGPAVDVTNTSVPPVIVGQMIKLYVTATPEPAFLAWLRPEIPGQVVENYTQSLAAGVVTSYYAGDFTCDPISFAWKAAANGPVNVETTSNLWDSYSVSASFDVVSPTATFGSKTNPLGVKVLPVTGVGLSLCFGDPKGRHGIDFTGEVTTPEGGDGQIATVQRICGGWDATTLYNQPIRMGTGGGIVLDNEPDSSIPQNAVTPIGGGSTGPIKDADSPYISLGYVFGWLPLARVSVNMQFETYLMYKPAGASIWVTLQLLTWEIAGEAALSGGTSGSWVLVACSACSPTDPQGQPSTKLPEWANCFTNIIGAGWLNVNA